MNLIIHPASINDAEGICDVHSSAVKVLFGRPYGLDVLNAWHNAMTVKKVEEAMRKPDLLGFVAEIEGRIFGFALLQNNLINAMYVHPLYRRKTVGSKLLLRMETETISRGIHSLTLNASLNAHPFYEKHGFRLIRENTTPLNESVKIDCLSMEKELTYK